MSGTEVFIWMGDRYQWTERVMSLDVIEREPGLSGFAARELDPVHDAVLMRKAH